MGDKKLELLSPAGDMERLRMAVAYGADAVYLAGDMFGMRSFAGNFSHRELGEAVELYDRDDLATLQAALPGVEIVWMEVH